MKWILRRGGGGFGATADGDSEPQQRWQFLAQGQGGFRDMVEVGS